MKTRSVTHTKIAFASGAGTALEFFDFLAYGVAAALVFNKIFFPKEDPLTGTLLALATFSVGAIARPLGSILFGHFGDRVGRSKVLSLTIVLMGAASVAVGLMPTYEQIGVSAPIGLAILRLIQGIAAGGEWAGAAVLAVEYAPNERKGLFGSWTSVGTAVGALLASIAFSLLGFLDEQSFMKWGWRVPFLASGILLVFGYYIRAQIGETPEFQKAKETGAARNESARVPLKIVVTRYPRQLLIAAAVTAGQAALTYLLFTFVLTYGTQELGLSRQLLINATLVALVAEIILGPFLGILSDRFRLTTVQIWASIFIAIFSFLLFPLLHTKNTVIITLALSIGYTAGMAVNAPSAALFSALFSTNTRYSGVGLGYQLGQAIGGGVSPLIAVALFSAMRPSTMGVELYVSTTALIGAIFLLIARFQLYGGQGAGGDGA